MSLTPNYSFIIPTGSDAVNLLTQCYPNFTSLDSILKPIQESGVTPATDTKVGTVHQLVRTDSSCNMFRFIATGNYASGDTFTVDGASVTATAMDGTALPNGAFVINQSVVCILNNLVLTVLIAGKETTSLPASSVTYDNTGSGLTATNAQDAIDEVYNSIPSIPSEHGLFEVWKNSDTTIAFDAQQINITSDKTFDSFIIEYGYVSSGTYHSQLTLICEVGEVALPIYNTVSTAGKLLNYFRRVTTSKSSNVYSLIFEDCTKRELNAYGTTPASSVDNVYLIPNRIFGIVHNT